MFIHQDASKDCIECWIELDKINFIQPQIYNGEICYYKLYLTGDDDPVFITKETFNKIIAEKGVV